MDQLQNFIFDNHPIRGQIVRLENVYQKVFIQQGYPEVIQQLLGEALLAICFLTGLSKQEGRVSLQFQGSGAISLITVQCTADLHVRGLVRYNAEVKDAASLATALGQGQMAVLYQPDKAGLQYQSIVPIEGHSIAEALTHYFLQSEQQMTYIRMARDDQHLVGFMLQMLPDGSDTKAMSWEHVGHLAETLTDEEMLACDNETLLTRLYHQEHVRVFDAKSVSFGCAGGKTRFENAILSLGQQEAHKLLDEHDSIEVTCDFCQKEFNFDRVDVEALFRGGQPNTEQAQ